MLAPEAAARSGRVGGSARIRCVVPRSIICQGHFAPRPVPSLARSASRCAAAPAAATRAAERRPLERRAGAFRPAASSLSRAICRRCGASCSSARGGNPAVPSSEFTSARFSARSRAVSSSSKRTYRPRRFRANHVINSCHMESFLPCSFPLACRIVPRPDDLRLTPVGSAHIVPREDKTEILNPHQVRSFAPCAAQFSESQLH